MDGDGDLDILVTNRETSSPYNGNNAMYVNQGGGELQKVTEGAFVTDLSPSQGLRMADIDGDGDLDVIVCGKFHQRAHQGMFINDGVGELQKVTAGEFVTDESKSHSLEVADIDGDSNLDVLVANVNMNHAMYMNAGEGELQKVTGGDFVSDVSPSS
jgi:hypothetical protein